MTDQSTNHTGRELELMLAGTKPLAMFYDNPDDEPDERIVPEREFDAYVASGQFVKGTRTFDLAPNPKTGNPTRVRYVLYALKEEAWRIPAMFLAVEIGLKVQTPSEALDRITSRLLGYTDGDIEKHFGYPLRRDEA